jgi:hypothetical protein
LPDTAAAGEAAKTLEERPLDDVMLAMDVVDTLRHGRRLAEKELASEENDAQLLRRLRDIYASQGIEVPDEILRQGVAALKEQRFVYEPPPSGFWTFLAWLYVTRKRWRANWIAWTIVIALAWHWDFYEFRTNVESLFGWSSTESTEAVETTRPVETNEADKAENAAEAAGFSQAGKADETMELSGRRAPSSKRQLLDNLSEILRSIEALPLEDAALVRAQALFEQGTHAAEAGDFDRGWEARDDLYSLRQQLTQTFEIRIVSRSDEPSGVWRVPDVNPEARNHYLIVEAIDVWGDRLRVLVTDEEDGQEKEVFMWGVRVSEATFEQVKADRLDDGIIQSATLAIKRSGRLELDYLIPVLGGVITEW